MFGQRLNYIRKSKGITAQQMSNELQIALRSYRMYESNNRSPSLEMLVKIADILNVSTDYLLCRDEFIQSCAVASGELKTNLPTYPKE
ncbi:MAG: helix-turn-helix transcriptional regulator [Lachnospiraceae bacterium]|nr:helix-turn-helix transcriptional regulator [Lachnospiraceae bacterium]